MIYRFGDFDLDTDRFELRLNGAVQHVEPLVFDLILFLSRNPGRVVSRDEIIENVWGGRIVSEATISGCVKSVRKALGDSGDRQTYLQTVRGRGFRFAADVSAETMETSATDTQGESTVRDARPVATPRNPVEPLPERTIRTEKPVLAVLPFDNMSADVDGYFSDGLTEDIITNLSRFRELRVIARTSSFQFRGRRVGLAEFCAALGAGFAVVGTVRRAGGRVRITAQLIDAVTDIHLWADSYDRDMEDIFAVQDEVTRTIAATLGVKMQDVALQHALRKGPAELDAYDCVLRARRYTAMLSADLHAEARDLLEKAIRLDPNNADAHALLANVYLAEHRFDANPRPDPITRALEMAQTAVHLDGQNAYARCWLAIVHFFRGENDKFEAEAQRALDLNPNDPETLADIGHFLAFMGEFERGVALSKQAQQLNPLHPGWYHFSFARYHYDRREYEDVLADVQIVGMPDFYWSYLLKAAAEGQLGRPEASETLQKIYDLKPQFSAPVELRKWNTAPEDFDHLMDGLRRAGLQE
jgi:TolB-like protein